MSERIITRDDIKRAAEGFGLKVVEIDDSTSAVRIMVSPVVSDVVKHPEPAERLEAFRVALCEHGVLGIDYWPHLKESPFR